MIIISIIWLGYICCIFITRMIHKSFKCKSISNISNFYRVSKTLTNVLFTLIRKLKFLNRRRNNINIMLINFFTFLKISGSNQTISIFILTNFNSLWNYNFSKINNFCFLYLLIDDIIEFFVFNLLTHEMKL